jgi:hypothetical protein
MSLPRPTFEPGYDRVVRLDFPERIHGTPSVRVGRRSGRTRVEADFDRAWEFDPAGRLIVAQEDSVSRHATFDGRVWGHRIVHSGSERRLVADPGPDDPTDWLAGIHQRIRDWRTADSSSSWVRGNGGSAEEFASDALGPASTRSPDVLRREVETAREIWSQVPVLPPDQYEALVLQISEGCPWDRCRFCSLYRDVPYRERSLAEIDAHLDEVLGFVGASASRIRRIFLGQANALLRDTGELLEILELIRQRIPFPVAGLSAREQRIWLETHSPSANGFYAFVDAFHQPRPVEEWRALKNAGLRRVYMGLESGDAQRLRKLGKPLDPEQAVAQTRDLHSAGLPAAVILMTGIAAPDEEAMHREKSAQVLGRMELRTGDQVYLSPLVHPAGAELEQFHQSDADLVRSGPALQRMREALRAALGRGVPIATYDLQRLAGRTPRG